MGSEQKKFLVGFFATLFATQRGHEKPIARDKADAEAMAASTADQFQYRLQFGAK